MFVVDYVRRLLIMNFVTWQPDIATRDGNKSHAAAGSMSCNRLLAGH